MKLFGAKVQGHADKLFWRIEMKDALKPGETAVVCYYFIFYCLHKIYTLFYAVLDTVCQYEMNGSSSS
jgi:hypothetical protein